MRRIKAVTALITVFLGLASPSAAAFDGMRKGFSLGLGLGMHHLDNNISSPYFIYHEAEVGAATSFRIGYGFNEKFSLFYQRNASWFDGSGETYIVGLTGVGANYYFSESVPSKYLIAAVGAGDYSTPMLAYDRDVTDGSALLVGFGYEFKQHRSVEINLGSTSLDLGSGYDLDSYALQLMFNYQFY